MEPKPLRSRMGESAPGQGQVGTHPELLAQAPGPRSVLFLTLLSSHILSYKRGAPVLHPTLMPASPHPQPGSLSCRNPQPGLAASQVSHGNP